MIQALDLIRQFEGYRETPYWDVNALRAGYGSDTITLADGRVIPVGKGARVSREDAERDLQRRVNTEFMPRVERALGADVLNALTPEQRAVLGSITYNYGDIPDSVARAVQTPGYEDDIAAINALGRHNNGVNAKRRAMEAQIYAGGAIPGYAQDQEPVNALAYYQGPQNAPQNRLAMQEPERPAFQRAGYQMPMLRATPQKRSFNFGAV